MDTIKNKVRLPNVTMIAVCGSKHGETIVALNKSMQQCDFAAVKLITNIDIVCTGIEVINVGGLASWDAYNKFCVFELDKYFTTSHCLIIQWDGYVLNGECWGDEFLDYDFIGAKWLDIGKPYQVGNGGFSLRSKKLQTILATDKNIITYCPEDVSICKVYGQYLMDNHGIKFAPEDIADKFSFELNEPMFKVFGFHAFHWRPFRKTIVVKRDYATGDVIGVEPLLEYFHKKGFQVSLDTSPQNINYFASHYFTVVPKNHLNPKLPYIEVDLNSAYEVFPEKLHLESYYDFAQVPQKERIIRNPRLSLKYNFRDKQNKLFKKYAVFHIDERNEPHRNIKFNWRGLVKYLKEEGYTCIQVGIGKHEEIEGAIFMRTPSEQFLMWVIASSDLFVGVDSAPSHVASGFDIPSIIFTGSVDLRLIHPDLSNKLWLHNHENNVCETPMCWHKSITETGQDCVVDKDNPPCVKFDFIDVLSKIKIFIKEKTINAISFS